MERLSRPKLAILDALRCGRVPLGCLFLEEKEYLELFNTPWHCVEIDNCCLLLSQLLKKGYLQTVRTGQGLSGLELEWTEKGGEAWADYFVVDLGKYITQEDTFEIEKEIKVRFTCLNFGHLEQFRKMVMGLIVMDEISVTEITPVSNEEIILGKIEEHAYNFGIVMSEYVWSSSLEREGIALALQEYSNGWRRPYIRCRKK